MKQLAWLIVVTACARNVQPVEPKPRFPAATPQPVTTPPSQRDTSPEKDDAAPAMATSQPATTPPSNKNTSPEKDDAAHRSELLTGEGTDPGTGEHTGEQHPRGTSGRIWISGKHALNQSTLTADLVVTKIEQVYMAGLKRCYRDYLRKDATARGKVEFDLTINQMGRTVNAKASGFASELDDCVTAQMREWRFPIPKDKDGDPTDTSFRITMTATTEPAPAPSGDPVQLSHAELAALREWPHPDVLPDDDDVQAMLRAGRPYVFASARMCIDHTGVPASVELVEHSGFASYDAKLVAAMRRWRYRPLTRDGEARPACAPVAFMYHPAIQLVTLRGCGFGAAFVGHQLFTSPTGSAVKVSYDGTQYDARLATFDGREPVDGKPVGILLSDYAGYELMLWAQPGDLAPVLRAPVLLARTPADVGRRIALRDPGLRIQRGAPVRILARKQQLVQVRILGDEPALTGWIPAAALGTTYHHELDALPRPGKRIYIASRTALLGQPGGTVLTELRAAERDQVVSELERQGDHVLVMVQDRRWWAIGWVPAQRILPAGSVDESHRFRGRPSSGNDQARIELPLGTLVYDKPRGRAFGRTNGRTTAQARQTADGHTRIDIELSGLTIEAWVANPPGAVQR